MALKKQLFHAGEIAGFIRQIARKIEDEFISQQKPFVLAGIYQQGVPLAERIAAEIKAKTGIAPEIAKIDISMYRDDFGRRSGLPLIHETVIPFDMTGQNVILVDDVLSSGRTIRAALDAVTDYGRPELIRLAVLVDRGEPEYPIRADFVGVDVKVPHRHKIAVELGGEAGDKIFEVEWQQ